MAAHMSHILRKCTCLRSVIQKNVRGFSATSSKCSLDTQPFICSKSSPVEHSIEDVGLVYTIDKKTTFDVLFKGKNVLQPDYVEECITFQETPILIRKPAVEIINCLNNTDYNKPINNGSVTEKVNEILQLVADIGIQTVKK